MLTPHLAFDSSLLNLSDILPGQPIRRETFEELRHMGYGAIEWHPHHKVWADRWYGKSAIEAAQLAHEAGLRSASVIARPVDACPGLGSAAESTLIDDLNLAKQLDARVAVVSLRGLDRWFKEAGERVAAVQIAETWRAAAREAGTRGLMLVWSIRPATMLDAPELLLQILDHVNIPNFGI